MVDEVMHQARGHITMVVCDSESCNHMVLQAIHGSLDAKLRRKIMDTKWFSQLTHRKIPGMDVLPRCPMMLAFDEDRAVYAPGGVAHAVKNSSSQVLTEHKLLYFGVYAADPSGSLQYGMPLPAFCKRDSMSDRLTALLSCPIFYISDHDALV